MQMERQNANPVQTFMKLPLALTPEDLSAGAVDVAICGVPFEMVITRNGTAEGPRAIRQAEYMPTPPHEKPHLSVRVDPFKELKVVDYGDAPVSPYDIDATSASVRQFVRQVVEAGVTPIILGGDHSITWPNVAALADVYGPGNVGVVHFDAHADAAPDMFGSLASHGTSIRRLIDDDHIPGKNFVQVGLRGYWPGDDVLDWMRENQMQVHFHAEIERFGFDRVMERAIDQALDGPEHLFISFDVDVLDPSHAPGTGAIEPGGLTTREILPMLRRLAHEVGVCGMDVLEVSPPYDTRHGVTAITAHRAVLEVLTGMAMRKLGIDERNYLHPEAISGMNS